MIIAFFSLLVARAEMLAITAAAEVSDSRTNDGTYVSLPRSSDTADELLGDELFLVPIVSGTVVENDKTRVGHTDMQMPQLMQLLFDISKNRPLSAKDLTGTPTSQKRSHIPQAMHRSFRLAIPNVRIDLGLALWKTFIRPTTGHQYRHQILPPKKG